MRIGQGQMIGNTGTDCRNRQGARTKSRDDPVATSPMTSQAARLNGDQERKAQAKPQPFPVKIEGDGLRCCNLMSCARENIAFDAESLSCPRRHARTLGIPCPRHMHNDPSPGSEVLRDPGIARTDPRGSEYLTTWAWGWGCCIKRRGEYSPEASISSVLLPNGDKQGEELSFLTNRT